MKYFLSLLLWAFAFLCIWTTFHPEDFVPGSRTTGPIVMFCLGGFFSWLSIVILTYKSK